MSRKSQKKEPHVIDLTQYTMKKYILVINEELESRRSFIPLHWRPIGRPNTQRYASALGPKMRSIIGAKSWINIRNPQSCTSPVSKRRKSDLMNLDPHLKNPYNLIWSPSFPPNYSSWGRNSHYSTWVMNPISSYWSLIKVLRSSNLLKIHRFLSLWFYYLNQTY